MSLGLYTDVHVPAQITTALRSRSVDVLTSQSDLTTTLPDPELLDRATSLARVLFTFDKDLLQEATLRQAEGKFFAGIIFAYPLRITLGQCIEDLELAAKVYDPPEMANRILYLPIR